jgi:hypothetical protein
MKKFFKNLWLVLVYSSANREKISLTIKSLLTIAVPFAINYFGINRMFADDVVNQSVNIIDALLVFVGVSGAVYGSIRKFVLTIVGEHDALQ